MLAIILTHRSTDDAMAAHKASGRFVDDRLDFNWAAREGYIRFV